MNSYFSRLLLGLFLLSDPLTAAPRPTIQLETGWQFQHEEKLSETAPSFENSDSVSIPHDWSWETGPQPKGAQKDKGGYRIGGVGWYRTEFTLPESFQNQTVFLCFDGVYRRSTIYLNGQEVGGRPYGFISFREDLTPFLKEGLNTLVVRADCSLEPSSRWYHPCGIFAPVYLEASHPKSKLVHDGVFITTPEVSDSTASVAISMEVEDPSGLKIEIKLKNQAGGTIDTQVLPATALTKARFAVTKPHRWSPDRPYLYQASFKLIQGDEVIDEQTIPFGIRAIEWSAEQGFLLNGEVTKLKGVCEHLTGGPVGGAWTEPLLEWKLSLLKEMGCNAIRTAHNPQIPAFYDLCDRMGILVMDEIFDGWKRKAEFDYGALDFKDWWQRDLTDWLRRDRNHPCVVIWSVGNETGGSVGKQLVETCHKIDPTRPVTSGHSASEAMDVHGVNGRAESQHFFKEDHSHKPFVATEAPHTWQVRGFYKTQTWYRDGFPNKRQGPFETPNLSSSEIFHNSFLAPSQMRNRKQIFLSSYDNAYVRINARQNWEKARDLPWYSGHFRWTGFDYPGEAGYVHGGWPFHTFASGALDLAGFEKDLYYLYRSQWQDEPMVHILPHWTHPRMEEGTLIPVVVYTNAEEVELLLNGASITTQKTGPKWSEMGCHFYVPWSPGTLTAIARSKGQEVARQEVKTSSFPSALKVETNSQVSGYSLLDFTTVDSEGLYYPYGENRVFVAIDDRAQLVSFENGHPGDTDRPLETNRRTFMGRARLFLKGPPSEMIVGAILGERAQLTSDQATIAVVKVKSDGSSVSCEPEIYYTTDGAAPSKDSKRYQGSFPVNLPQTVKAVVYLEDQLVLEMKEEFDPAKGIHWSTGEDSATPAETSPPSNALQAETAKFKNGRVKKSGQGWRGQGYLDFASKEGEITFYQENDGPAGKATLVIRYANNSPKSERPLALTLNQVSLGTHSFPNTGSWSSKWKTVEIPVQLQRGANTLVIKSTGQTLPNIDEVEFR